MKTTIKECWESFQTKVLEPAEVSDHEIEKAKMGFYAGITAMLNMQANLAKAPGASAETVGKYVEGWRQEIFALTAEVMTNVVIATMKEDRNDK